MMTATRIDRGSTDTTTIYSVDGDLVYEREFDAPRDLVWRANTEAALIPRWWGPRGHTTRVEEMDVRAGGKWRFVSVDGSGNEFAFYGEYLEVVPPERITWTFMFDVEGVGPQGGPETLTPRELEVLTLLAQGRSNGEIAAALSIAPRTAKVHVQNILSKLGATNRTEAVSVAVRQGLISL